MKQINQSEHITIDVPTQRVERNAWVSMPLPDLKTMDRFFGWALGRLVLGSGLFLVEVADHSFRFGSYCCGWLRTGMKKITQVYDSLPLMGVPLQSVVAEVRGSDQASGLIEPTMIDLLDGIKGKHLLVIGGTGSGKSTITQWLATQHGTNTKVYDPDCAPGDWVGLQVFGRKGNFTEIEQQMQADLAELEELMALRGEHGDSALAGRECCLIGEEYPLLATEVDTARDWLLKHARRGRRVKRFVIALSQTDSVAALGIEGDGGIRQSFAVLRLGKFAVTHAKKLKNDSLVGWLQAGKFRALLDDDPCQLPDLRGYTPVTNVVQSPSAISPAVTPEKPTQQALEPIAAPLPAADISLKSAVRGLKSAGWSDSRIIKEILKYEGSRYQKGKELLDSLLNGE